MQCDTCPCVFPSLPTVWQHMNVGRQIAWSCNTCDFASWCEFTTLEHMNNEDHWTPRFNCEACNMVFETRPAARKHMDAMNHWRVHYCMTCEKGFQNENNFRQHMYSNIHRGSNIACPFCRRGFTTATGVTTHLETGSCPNARNVNHASILAEIRRRDPNHLLTKKLLTYPSSSSPATITATSASYNHHTDRYECYLCHRGFTQLIDLNQHVNSPAHRQHVYHCPGRGCIKEFKALAGLFNHLESETCGAVRFEAVQRNVTGFDGGRRLIGFA
ncbi:hypothetical protein CC80DRAFT_514305 [Byssothecium circinans]|uniref:C2H2-type domain-containing protein n=1 Tax=Byssothecium circinans TaxID=147558 RepID=A0A6A5UFK5_9PLEO|nr:hypothetical protein CC80DRAFT_514305 [Byssothecium circinans]